MGKRIAFLVLLVLVPIAIASLVQSYTSEPAETAKPESSETRPAERGSTITVSSGHVGDAELHNAVDSLLAESAAAWNRGDLAGFLIWYERAPSTSFVGASGRLQGWDAIRARYRPWFEKGADRDSLRFEELSARSIGPGLGLATARYVLFERDSTTSTGMFTLVLEETSEGWRIIHDHSSEDPS